MKQIKPVSKKIRSKTPLLFAIPKELKENLNRVPRLALENFSKNNANINDWETLAFRMRSCYEISKEFYVEETQKQIYLVCELLEKLFFTFNETGKIEMDKDQIETISFGLDAMEQMQDEVTRKQMLNPYYRTREYMKQFAK